MIDDWLVCWLIAKYKEGICFFFFLGIMCRSFLARRRVCKWTLPPFAFICTPPSLPPPRSLLSCYTSSRCCCCSCVIRARSLLTSWVHECGEINVRHNTYNTYGHAKEDCFVAVRTTFFLVTINIVVHSSSEAEDHYYYCSYEKCCSYFVRVTTCNLPLEPHEL